MSLTHPVIVPARVDEPPMLTLDLTIDETLNVLRRHLTRIAAAGNLRVEFRSTRRDGGRGLTTTIHCDPAP